MLKRLLLTVAFLVISIELNFAAIPQKISYQGVLKNSVTGIVVPDGTYSMYFALYSSQSGGSAVWSETQPSVQVTQGVFSVELGSVTAIPTSLDYNNPFYLGVSFNGGSEMTPRVAINMAPYSSNANTANNATHATNADYATNANHAVNSDNTNAIRGINVSTTTLQNGNILKYNGSSWIPNKPFEIAESPTPDRGDVLVYEGAYWAPSKSVNYATQAGNADNTNAIRGVNVSSASPKTGDLLKFDGTNWTPTKPEVAVCRWNVFDANDYYNISPAFESADSLTLGIKPGVWNSTTIIDTLIIPDKEYLRSFFIKKCYAKSNAMIYNESYSSSTATYNRYAFAIFRIKNTTDNDIFWYPYFYYSSYPFNTTSIYSSYVFLNGKNIWSTPLPFTLLQKATITIKIPKNSTKDRISTVIFVSSSTSPRGSGPYYKSCRLAFKNLQLPSGLEFVDDLDTATGGWDQ